jgi:hypothetical protein
MFTVIGRASQALLGLAMGFLAVALLVEVPGHVRADGGGGEFPTVICTQTITTCLPMGGNCQFDAECGLDGVISCYCHDYGSTCPCEHY